MLKQSGSNVSGHLIQGAFYVLLLLAVCVIPIALAQRIVTNPSRAVQPQVARRPDAFAVATADTSKIRLPPET